MKRVPSYRKSIVKVDALLAKYASSAGLLDALHAMAILDDVVTGLFTLESPPDDTQSNS